MNVFNRKLSLFVFAAGLGTRLRPATLHHPKPCIPMNQIPLGYYFWPYLESIHVDQHIANTFYLPDQIKSLYKKMNPNFIFSDEADFIKGSAGGLKQAEKWLKDTNDILAVNADEIFFTKETNFLKNALLQHQNNKSLATLIVTEHPEAGKKFGAIWVDSLGIVKHIGKNKPDSISDKLKPFHFIGLQFLDNSVLNEISEGVESNIFYDVLIQHLNENKVQVYKIDCDWFEVGNKEDYLLTKKMIHSNILNQPQYIQHFDKLKELPLSNLSDLSE